MTIVKIQFRVPEGEELTDDRIAALSEIGVKEVQLASEDPGRLTIRRRFRTTSLHALEEAVEEFAESVIELTGDMDMLDFEIPD